MEKIAVYTLFDDNYFDYGATLIYSFFKYNEWFEGDFVVINDDKYCILSDENKEKLSKISKHIKFTNIKSDDYNDLINNQKNICEKKFISCFYKLEIFRGIYDKVVWIDSDCLVDGDIKGLFENSKYNGRFCACLDCISWQGQTDEINKGNGDYFNGGVYRVDKELIKKYNFEKLYKFCGKVTKNELVVSPKARGNGLWVDQDCFNYYFEDSDVLILPATIYNANPYLSGCELCDAKIFHYYRPDVKPNGSIDRSGRYKCIYDPWHKMNNEFKSL